MSHNFDSNAPPHRTPPNQPNTIESLMNSLISPGPGTPMQGAFQNTWLANNQSWQDNNRGFFGQTVQNPTQGTSQSNFPQSNEGDYTPYDPNDTFQDNSQSTSMGQEALQNSEGGTFPPMVIPSQGEITPTGGPKSTPQITTTNNPAPKQQATNTDEAAAENAKRLRELRAVLLAKKPKGSREASPALRMKGPTPNAQTNAQNPSATLSSPSPLQASTVNGSSPASNKHKKTKELQKRSHPAAGSGISSDLDNLFDEVRKESRAVQEILVPVKTKASGNAGSKKQGAKSTVNKNSTMAQPFSLQENRRPSSDLSDGEIRSDEEQAPASKENPTPETLPKPKETSRDLEEKSRRESEVEATYQPPATSSRDSQEKLRRQSQVDQTYSPLKNPNDSKPRPPNPQLNISTPRKISGNLQKSPKSAIEHPSRPWTTQSKAKAGDYDSYVPPYRKSSLQERPIGDDPPIGSGKRNANWSRIDLEDRRRAIEQNELAAAEYKRALESRPQPSRVMSHTDTEYVGRVNERSEITNDPGAQQVTSSQISPTEATNSTDADLKDWLELTEYHDEEYRKNRLSRFRKKKQLDQLRLQLDQEEQLELQRRSFFRASVLPSNIAPQKTTQMAPPTLPLRETSTNDGLDKNKTEAAAQSDDQVAIPTLKRQHAEDDTDARNKVARVDNVHSNFYSQSSSFRDEPSPGFPGSLPLEHRISRDDNQMTSSRYRPRSRSPERFRRRSASPERRRFSVPDHNFMPTCRNCGRPGHYQNTCVEPRRDGRERYRAPPTTLQRPNQRFPDVSPNYLGKNPQRGYKDPRAGRNNSVGRSNDDDEKRS